MPGSGVAARAGFTTGGRGVAGAGVLTFGGAAARTTAGEGDGGRVGVPERTGVVERTNWGVGEPRWSRAAGAGAGVSAPFLDGVNREIAPSAASRAAPAAIHAILGKPRVGGAGGAGIGARS